MFQELITKAVSIIALTTVIGSLNSNISIPTTEYENSEESDVIAMLKDEVRYTQHWDEGCEDHTIQLTQYEAYLLMSVASAEALDQGTSGMLKVMMTIVNRQRSPEFPNTIYGVISQKGQFTSFSTGAYLTADISPEVHLALAELEMNKNHDDNLIAFESVKNNSLLVFFDYYETFKDHVFYKIKTD